MRIVLILVLLLAGCQSQAVKYADRNPPVSVFATEREASMAATLDMGRHYGRVYGVSDTGSMLPTLRALDYAMVSPLPFNELALGDIVVYVPVWAGGKLVVHRLVLFDDGGWIASGDNNRWSESWERVTAINYVGKVVRVYRVDAGGVK